MESRRSAAVCRAEPTTGRKPSPARRPARTCGTVLWDDSLSPSLSLALRPHPLLPEGRNGRSGARNGYSTDAMEAKAAPGVNLPWGLIPRRGAGRGWRARGPSGRGRGAAGGDPAEKADDTSTSVCFWNKLGQAAPKSQRPILSMMGLTLPREAKSTKAQKARQGPGRATMLRLHIKITPEGQTPAHLAGLGGGSSTGRVVAVVPFSHGGSSSAARDRIGVVISVVALAAEQPGCALRIGVALSCTRSQVGRAVVIASCDLYVAVGAFVDRSHAVVGVASATGDVSDAVGIWVVADHLFEHGTVGGLGGGTTGSVEAGHERQQSGANAHQRFVRGTAPASPLRCPPRFYQRAEWTRLEEVSRSTTAIGQLHPTSPTV